MNLFFHRALLSAGLLALAMPLMADVVVVGGASGSDTNNGRDISFSVNVPADAELAVVGVTNMNDRGTEYVRFAGHANMTFVIDTEPSGMDERAQIFYFKNPPVGSQTIQVRMTNDTRRKAAGCLLLKGVDLDAFSPTNLPLAKYDGAYYDNNPTPTLTFSGAEAPSGSLAISVINNRGNGLTILGGHHTERWNIETAYTWDFQPASRHGGGTAPGSSVDGVSLSWSPSAGVGAKANWGMAAIVVPAKYFGPSGISPETLNANDSDANGTVVGTLIVADPDNKPPYTWSLPDNGGGRFSLSASQGASVNVLIANATLIDHGQAVSHTIRVGVRNAEYPDVLETDITINVLDTTPPSIGPVSSTQAFRRFGEFVQFSSTISDNTALAAVPVMRYGGVPLTLSQQNGDEYTWAWNVPLSAPEGPVTMTISATDTTNNTTEYVAAGVVIVDNIAPALSNFAVSSAYAKPGDLVVVGVDIWDVNGVTAYPSLFFRGTAVSDPTVSGDRYTWEFPVTLDMAEGTAELAVSAYDGAGNHGQGITSDLLTIDKTPPIITAISSSRYYAKLGDIAQFQTSVVDNFGLAQLPAMRLNGDLLAAPTQSGNLYVWQYQVTAASIQGPAIIEVEASDYAGNVNTVSPGSAIFVIDRTAPVISGLNAAPALATVGTTITLTAEVSEENELDGLPVMTINGYPVSSPSASGDTYTWQYIVPASAVEGPTSIRITARDKAGNQQVLNNGTALVFDPNGPVFSSAAVSPYLAKLGQNVTILVNVYDLSGLDGVPTLMVNDLPATHVSIGGATHIFNYTVTEDTVEGLADLNFQGRDTLGNESTAQFTGRLLVDKTPPVVNNLSSNPSVARQGVRVAIAFDAYDALAEVYGMPVVSVNGANASFYSKMGHHYVYHYTVRAPALDANGPATVLISVYDTTGNRNLTERMDLLTIDSIAPAVSNLAVFPHYARNGDEVIIGFSVIDDSPLSMAPVVRINDNPATFVASEDIHYEYTYTVRAGYDEDGPALIWIRLQDNVGNVGVSESAGLLTVDMTPPTGTLLINDGAVFSRTAAVSLGITYDDGPYGSGTEAVSFSNDGLNWSSWEPVVEAALPWQLLPGQGYKTVYMRLRDYAGNVSTAPITDTIALNPSPLMVERRGPGEVKGLVGYAAILEIVPQNVFGFVRSYEWWKDGKRIDMSEVGDQAAGPVLALDNLHYEDQGDYYCRVSDEFETAESLPFHVFISETVPASRVSTLVVAALLIAALFASGSARGRKKYPVQ